MTDTSKVAKVVAHMIALRDARGALKKQFEEEDRKLRALYEKGEAFLLGHLNASGVDSFKVDSVGTVFTGKRLKASIGDRNAFTDFIKTSGEVELMNVAVNTTALKEFMEQHDGALPPGVNAVTDRTLNIRRT